MIKAVFFDVDDTLLDFKECSRQSIIVACEKYGLSFDEHFFNTFIVENQKLWWALEKGEITKTYLFANRWNIIFKVLGIDFDGPTFEIAYHEGLDKSHVVIDGAIETLEYVKSKYITCVASNAALEQQINRLKLAGMDKYIDFMFVSGKIGVEKPNKGFFDYCFNVLKLKPEETMMVGDSISADINGAKKYGMQTCLFDRCHTLDSSCADYYINNLSELKNIL